MARGNERDEARKKAEKKAGGVVSYPQLHVSPDDTVAQNVLVHANWDNRVKRTLYVHPAEHFTVRNIMANIWVRQQTGTEFRRQQESVADIMRQKQAAGMSCYVPILFLSYPSKVTTRDRVMLICDV
jgi:hypothetical protein